MYKNEKFSFKLMISVNGYTEKPTSKDNIERRKLSYSISMESVKRLLI